MKKHLFTFISILFALGLVFLFSNQSMAASLRIRYNGKQYKYQGNKINAYIDNKKIDMKDTKGILINNNIMVSYKDVFKSGAKASCTYDAKNGKIKIKANGNTLKLKIGSRNATVNGKKHKLEQAPLKVKYIKMNKTKVLVPAKFVAEGLGYSYSYETAKSRIYLTSPFSIQYNNTWHVYKKYQGGLVYNNVSVDMSNMPVLSIGGSTMVPAEFIYKELLGLDYSYDNKSNKIKISNGSNSILMTLGSTSAVVNDTTMVTLKTAPLVVKRKDTGYSCLMVPTSSVTNALGFYYTWDSNIKVAYIHTKTYFNWEANNLDYDTNTFSNALTAVNAGYELDNNRLVFSIQFAQPISSDQIMVTEEAALSTINLDFVATHNLIPGMSAEMNAQSVSSVSSDQMETGSRITITTKDSAGYTYNIENNTVKVYISEMWNADYGLRISRPDEAQFFDYSIDDYYRTNKFVVSVSGDYTEFYKANPVTVNSGNVVSANVTYNVNTQRTEIAVITSSLQGSKLVNLGKIIGVIVDKPENVYEYIVALDAGHGGSDPGAVKNGYNESNLNLTVIYNYAKDYFNSSSSPVKAYWTRTDDTFISLADRAKFAATVNADIFVSLHMNSSTSSAAKGTEVYYCSTNNAFNKAGLNSYRLATACLDSIVPAIGTSSRGVKSANYYVIKNNTVPAVLIELGFMSNSTDLNTITNKSIQQAAAKAIYDAIIKVSKK